MDEAAEDWEVDEGGLIEHAFGCPYCGELVTMLVDLSEPDQEYIEDCEVCCNPIGVRVRARGGVLESFEASTG
jgi:transcription elongation factor Elf1